LGPKVRRFYVDFLFYSQMEAVHKEKEAKKEQRLREAGVPPPRPDEFGQAGGNVPRGVPPPPPPGPPPGGKFRERKKTERWK
jgi:hypothetical protein